MGIKTAVNLCALSVGVFVLLILEAMIGGDFGAAIRQFIPVFVIAAIVGAAALARVWWFRRSLANTMRGPATRTPNDRRDR